MPVDPAARAKNVAEAVATLTEVQRDLAEVIDALPGCTDEQLEFQQRILARLSEEVWEASQLIRDVARP